MGRLRSRPDRSPNLRLVFVFAGNRGGQTEIRFGDLDLDEASVERVQVSDDVTLLVLPRGNRRRVVRRPANLIVVGDKSNCR